LTEAVARLSAAIPKDASPRVFGESCDVRDAKAVAALFKTVKRRFGKLDILVNNAGITQPVVAVQGTSLQIWRDVVETNLTGVFLCTQAALPLMSAGATIINNLSAAARQVFPNYATYSSAKRGALGFTLSLREELIPRGIRVTALMTGATATDMWDEIMPDAPREKMIDVESVAQAVLYAVLLPPNVNLSELCLDPAGGAL
jgi:NAD(P)-dependent dehydrogenase (short-subunit alcohol dehydrogenase family)